MRKSVLILGGTMFVGRALVESLLLVDTYDITLYNRGKTNTNLFPTLKQIHGDRELDDYSALTSQYWDVIIDCSGYYPASLARLLSQLAGRVGRYIFISTMSVFDLSAGSDTIWDDDMPTLGCTQTEAESLLPDAYGQKKAEMERILLGYPAMQPIMLRPAFIYGRYDYTDRLYYWLYQARTREHILLPAGEHSISLTYIDHLSQMVMACMEQPYRQAVYLTVSVPSISLQQIVLDAAKVMGRLPTLHTITDDELESMGHKQAVLPLHTPIDIAVAGNKIVMEYQLSLTDWWHTLTDYIAECEALGWPVPSRGLSSSQIDEILANRAS
jgi:2'-hydroxyisoflavone reductase